jgi:hypothetical protein
MHGRPSEHFDLRFHHGFSKLTDLKWCMGALKLSFIC